MGYKLEVQAQAKLQADCELQAESRLQAGVNNQIPTRGAHRNPAIEEDRHKRHTTPAAQERPRNLALSLTKDGGTN